MPAKPKLTLLKEYSTIVPRDFRPTVVFCSDADLLLKEYKRILTRVYQGEGRTEGLEVESSTYASFCIEVMHRNQSALLAHYWVTEDSPEDDLHFIYTVHSSRGHVGHGRFKHSEFSGWDGVSPVGEFTPLGADKSGADHARQSACGMFIAIAVVFADRLNRPRRTPVDTGMVLYADANAARGDSVVYKRVYAWQNLHKPDTQLTNREPGASGIRKREHDVTGHWRHYRSGAKVWVRGHKRGDPALGTVTKVYTP